MKQKDQPIKKLAIVTGGSSGLGLAMAEKFVAHGIVTIIAGRGEERLKKASASLGDLCVPWPMDITRLDLIPTHVKEIAAQYGRIDILVNNAGINLKKDLVNVTDEEFQKILLTNLVGVFAISREVSKVMIVQKKGSIINISSMAAHYGIPKVVAYSASKAAIEGMTRSMAVDLSPHGILVNCVAPGFIKTNMSSAAFDSDPERKRRVLERTPLGTLGLPEDVANAVYFLISNENAYITGAVVPVDGGNAIGF
jgi:NAD(P)-dependent dehydrogenase (short-subunit alcohol dehydrogenase family)